MTVLPFGKSSIISGAMLGLGRALGETMAVTIILSVSGIVTFNLISQANPSTIAANIALDFPESSGLAINTLIASGLVLFAITLVTNLAARAIIAAPEHPVMEAASAPPRGPAAGAEGGLLPQLGALRRGRRLRAVLGRGAAAGRWAPSASPCSWSSPSLVAMRRHLRLVARGRGPAAGQGPADDAARSPPPSALALIPLLSLLFEVAKRGIPGLDIEFLTESARGFDRRAAAPPTRSSARW